MKFRWSYVVLALVFAGTAHAQQRTRFGGEVSTADAALTLHNFSRCVAHRWPERARAILAMDFTTDEYRRRIRTFAHDVWQCAPQSRLSFSLLPFAGNMAEALLVDEAGNLAERVSYDPARPPLVARSETEAMALCAVRAAPQEVSRLLATQVFSDEEAAALREIRPEVQSCLAAGISVSLNRIDLRSMLALAAYRLAEHNRAPVAQSAAASGS